MSRRQRDMCTVDRQWAQRAIAALAKQREAEQRGDVQEHHADQHEGHPSIGV
jgi:hypothetical protein